MFTEPGDIDGKFSSSFRYLRQWLQQTMRLIYFFFRVFYSPLIWYQALRIVLSVKCPLVSNQSSGKLYSSIIVVYIISANPSILCPSSVYQTILARFAFSCSRDGVIVHFDIEVQLTIQIFIPLRRGKGGVSLCNTNASYRPYLLA